MGEQRDNFQSDICHGVLGQAEKLTEQVSLEVKLREETERHLAHSQEQHSGVTALPPSKLRLDLLDDADPLLLLDGEPQDDEESSDCCHSVTNIMIS